MGLPSYQTVRTMGLMAAVLLLAGCGATIGQKSALDAFLQGETVTVEEREQQPTQSNRYGCMNGDDPRLAFRKRVGVMALGLQRREDAVDMPYIEEAYGKALIHRLDDERLIVVDATHFGVLYHSGDLHPARQSLHTDRVKQLADKLGVQFIVTGRLLDLSFARGNGHLLSPVGGINHWKSMAGALWQRTSGKYPRQFSAELSVYDGSSGMLIQRQQYSGEAPHEMIVSQGAGFGSYRFWQSQYGQLVSDQLAQQTQMVESALACLPMRSQVIAANGSTVEIKAGTEALLIPGDRLQLFHREGQRWSLDGTRTYKLKHVGSLTVTRVYPSGAMGTLDDARLIGLITPGDVVQAW